MKPYWKSSSSVSSELFLSDCNFGLNGLKQGSVSLVFADPPYFLSGDGITCRNGKMQSVKKADWDAPISVAALHEFNISWLSACREVLSDSGTIFISGTHHNIHSVGFALQQLGFSILNDITWFKINPPPNLSCRYFTHSTETIIWAKKSKKSKHYFNYQRMREIGDPNPGKQMLSLWRIMAPRKNEKLYGRHPTQKPVQLMSRIVEAASQEDDLVVDPFVGSGTSGVAAAIHKRRFIGFDTERSYLDVAKRRIEDIVNLNPVTLKEVR